MPNHVEMRNAHYFSIGIALCFLGILPPSCNYIGKDFSRDYIGKDQRLYDSTEGIIQLIREFNQEFGKGSGYLSIDLKYDEKIGLSGYVLSTKDTNSFVFKGKKLENGKWELKEEITVNIENKRRPRQIMFTMDEGVFQKLPKLIEKAKESVRNTQSLSDLVADHVLISFPVEDQLFGFALRISVYLKSRSGSSTVYLTNFNRDGDFISFISIRKPK